MTPFEHVYFALPHKGWLSEKEASLLWRMVQATSGPILEVGVYYGRSTCLMAAAAGPKRPVYAVDPFMGFDTTDVTGEGVRAAFEANLRSRGLTNVRLFPCRIEDWQPPSSVGLAYLDGDHTFFGTQAQIRAAWAASADVILIHDVNDKGDGILIREAARQSLGPWTERVERLAVWDRWTRETT